VTDDISFGECFRTEYSGWVFRVLTIICFLFLAIAQGAYGIKLFYLQDWQILGRLSSSKELLIVVNIIVSLSFASRVGYQWIVMALPQIHLPDVFLQVFLAENHSLTSSLIILLIFKHSFTPRMKEMFPCQSSSW
jgi:hypothetical protein